MKVFIRESPSDIKATLCLTVFIQGVEMVPEYVFAIVLNGKVDTLCNITDDITIQSIKMTTYPHISGSTCFGSIPAVACSLDQVRDV